VASKGKPHRTLNVDGFDVLIGRGDEENEILTFEIADRHDFWLHVAGGTPGSHVVVKNPDRLPALPASILERAAELAAWYSKARGAPRVEVHACRVSDVSKPRGAPAGLVELRRYQSLRVRPKPA
jgi:predicted ribosome quality control (RQC) complex YloA/Tae2 family protein